MHKVSNDSRNKSVCWKYHPSCGITINLLQWLIYFTLSFTLSNDESLLNEWGRCKMLKNNGETKEDIMRHRLGSRKKSWGSLNNKINLRARLKTYSNTPQNGTNMPDMVKIDLSCLWTIHILEPQQISLLHWRQYWSKGTKIPCSQRSLPLCESIPSL